MRAAKQRHHCGPAAVRRHRQEDALQLDRRRCCGPDPAALWRICRTRQAGGSGGSRPCRRASGSSRGVRDGATRPTGYSRRRGGAGRTAGCPFVPSRPDHGREDGGPPGCTSGAPAAAGKRPSARPGTAPSARPQRGCGACVAARRRTSVARRPGPAVICGQTAALDAPARPDHFRTAATVSQRPDGSAPTARGALCRKARATAVAFAAAAAAGAVAGAGRSSGGDRLAPRGEPRGPARRPARGASSSRPGGPALSGQDNARPAPAPPRRSAPSRNRSGAWPADLQGSHPTRPAAHTGASRHPQRPSRSRWPSGERARPAPHHPAAS